MPFVTCGPNEVLVVSGCCLGKPLLISGGKKFVWSGLQKAQKLCLNVMTLVIVSPRIYTKLGVPVTVTGVAQIKIEGRNSEMLRAACEQFLGYTPKEVSDIAKETLEAHQRAIMGIMTIEEIYQDRKKFSEEVFKVASSDLINMGISVVSYTIKDISDDEGYLIALGRGRTAQVIKDARIGEAEAKRDAEIRIARAELARMQSKLENDTAIAKAARDFEIKKTNFQKEVHTMEAVANMAHQLQTAKTKQLIKEEEMQVKVIERDCQIRVQELDAVIVEKSKTASVRKAADAEKFRMEILAEADKIRQVKEAEANSESIIVKGDAKAFAIDILAKADAAQLSIKADAWKEYKEAAKMEMVLAMLPQLAAEVAQPLASLNKVTMISNGDSDIGISKLTGEVMSVMQCLSDVVNKMARGDKLEH